MHNKLYCLSLVLSIISYSICASSDVSSIWPLFCKSEFLDAKKVIPRKTKTDLYVQDCKRLAANNNTIPQHVKNDTRIRIATYNVHYWCDAYQAWSNPNQIPNFDAVISAIKTINADILLLQEVTTSPTTFHTLTMHTLLEVLSDLGYRYTTFHKTMPYHEGDYGNMIVSKYPFKQECFAKIYDANIPDKEPRGYIRATIELPNKKNITVFTTHLDVWDDTEEIRSAQIRELLDTAAYEQDPVLIAGDFNAIRKKDLLDKINNFSVWDLVTLDNIFRGDVITIDKALQLFESYQYKDSFTLNHKKSPSFTTWSGIATDFIFIKEPIKMPILGSYIFYDPASDHLPSIVDLQI